MRRPVSLVVVLVALFATAGTIPVVASGASAPSVAASHAPRGASPSNPSLAAPAPPPPVPAHYYHLVPNIASQPASKVYCSYASSSAPPSIQRYCFPQAQNPSALHLANGDIAVAYSILTNYTTTACALPANETNSRIGVSLSADGGLTFGNITYLGNNSCPYLNAIEPSFGVSTSGAVYGAFVEENYSNLTTPLSPGLPPNYGNRTYDALGFVSSVDNATTWTPVRTILGGGYIARPALATIGDTIYITYTDTQNGTTPLGQVNMVPRVDPLPEAVKMIVSTDDGATWSSPMTLPGENATEDNTSFGASIAVSATGTVAVAYATDRSCLVTLGYAAAFACGPTSYGGAMYGESVVVVTSDTNGSSWHGPTTIGPAAAEAGCYGYNNESYASYAYPPPCLSYLFELTPQTSVAFGASNQTIYVAYSGGHQPYYYFDENSNVSVAVSTDGGRLWNSTVVENAALNNVADDEEYSTPSIGYSAGTVYLAYLEKNGTSCFISNYCSLLLGSYIEWITTSTNGLNWTNPSFVAAQTTTEYTPQWYDSFSGYTAAMTFTTAGKPVIAFALDQRPDSSAGAAGNVSVEQFDFGTVLDVAVGNSGPTVSLKFVESGEPASASWNVSVDGQNYTVAAGLTTTTVTGVPAGQAVKIEGPTGIGLGYWTKRNFVSSAPELASFTSNATVYFNGSLEYGLAFAYVPDQYPDYCMCVTLDGAYYIYIPITASYYIAEPAFPWYFPAGTNLTVVPQLNQGSDPTQYYVGNGTGSYTGPGDWANLTMDGPVNETVWNGLLGNGSLAINATGLPLGTVYQYEVDGVGHAGIAGTTSYIDNLNVGPHTVSGGWANATAGDEYISTPASTTVVLPYESNVTLSFADVDLASSLGTVTLSATGLPTGATWTVSFNGTLYESDHASINVTSRSGTFPFATYSSVTLSGSVGYAPTTHGPTVHVASGGTSLVNYTSAYEVRVAAGVGGTDSAPLSQWVIPGTVIALNATALPSYNFVGWSGVGNGSYSGPLAQTTFAAHGPIAETAVFAALPGARFNLTFQQGGVPAGSYWTVQLNGQGFSSDGSTLQVPNLYSCAAGGQGLYALSVPVATDGATSGVRYVAGTVNGTVCTTGTTMVYLQYSTQYLVNATASTAGASVSVTCGLSVGPALWCDAGTSASLAAPSVSGLNFAGWVGTGPGAYSGPLADPSFTPTGPVSEVASYVPLAAPLTYSVTLSARPGLAVGTTWQATAGGRTYSSNGPTLVLSGFSNGSVTVQLSLAVSPDGSTQYTPAPASVAVTVLGNVSRTVNFTVGYRGTISSNGAGTTGPVSGWFPANSTVSLAAVPDSGQTFVGWTGTGGSYSGPLANTSFSVSGPFSEVATFAPAAAPPATTTSSPSVWSSPLTWAGLAVVGLIVGLAVGVVLSRRGKPPAGATEDSSEPAPTEPPMADDDPAPPEGA
jgi:hypothetical protein